MRGVQETVCGQVQPYQSHVATQEQQTETLQVSTLQQGLPEGGSAGATHEISQVRPFIILISVSINSSLQGDKTICMQRVWPSVHSKEQLAETCGRT